mgnify:CR=1 FL=1
MEWSESFILLEWEWKQIKKIHGMESKRELMESIQGRPAQTIKLHSNASNSISFSIHKFIPKIN